MFGFMDCPTCKTEIKAGYCKEIENELAQPRQLKQQVIKKALERAAVEGIDKHDRLKDPGDPFYNNL